MREKERAAAEAKARKKAGAAAAPPPSGSQKRPRGSGSGGASPATRRKAAKKTTGYESYGPYDYFPFGPSFMRALAGRLKKHPLPTKVVPDKDRPDSRSASLTALAHRPEECALSLCGE